MLSIGLGVGLAHHRGGGGVVAPPPGLLFIKHESITEAPAQTFTFTPDSGAWEKGVYSQEAFSGPVQATVRVLGALGYFKIAFTRSPTVTPAGSDFDAGMSLTENGEVFKMYDGANVEAIGSYVVGDLVKVVFDPDDGARITLYKNGAQLGTQQGYNLPSSGPVNLLIACQTFLPGKVIEVVSLGAA